MRSATLSSKQLVFICTALVAVCLAVKLLGYLWVNSWEGFRQEKAPSKYSEWFNTIRYLVWELILCSGFVGFDFPESWPVERRPVFQVSDSPTHFRLDTQDGIRQWQALVPNDGVIYLGPHMQPFTIAMMHQLRCLDIIRHELVTGKHTDAPSSVAELSRHCMNYLRQMVMCHADTSLESFQYTARPGVDQHVISECNDWEAVYQDVRENQEKYISPMQGD